MKVSIITPYYHGAAYMKQYTECILANQKHMQPEDELEVILINDSPEERLELPVDGSRYNIWTYDQKENQGIHAARVQGLQMCRGEYVMFLDQDDLLAENAIARQIEKIRTWQMQVKSVHAANPEVQGTRLEHLMLHPVSVSNALLEQPDGSKLLWYRSDFHKGKVGDYKTYLTVGTQIISPGQCLIPRSAIPDVWCERICKKNGADDYYLWILLLANKVPFIVLDEPLYIHKYTGENLSEDTKKTDASTYEFLDYLEEEKAIEPGDRKRLRRMIGYKDRFRGGNVFTKCVETLRNFDIFWVNLWFKMRSKTPYGFNRS